MSNVQLPDALLINGERRESGSGGTIELVDPATETPLCTLPAAGRKEVDEALGAARAAFDGSGWDNINPTKRREALFALARLIREHADEIAEIEARNVGKPIGDARWEINAGARCFEYYAGGISRFGGETIPVSSDGFDFTVRVPVGVVAAIVPWNFPFLMACWKVAPALATGNAVLLKPASLTPLSALRMGELAWEAGVPEGILQVIAGPGSQIGDYLVSHREINKIAFTGETGTGARILKQAADDIKRVSLELGGKSANVVFADADIEAAARQSPMGVFANTGQDCCARSRVLIERSAYDDFRDAFVAATKEIVVGEPLDESTMIGPMVSRGQRETVEGYINLAKDEGARVLCGADRPRDKGFYLSPTVIDGVGNDARVNQEEIFGPVVSLIPFDDEAEAVRLANATPYGLSGSLWTKDVSRALRLARSLRSGVLGVNTVSSVFQEAPFGGFKQSGFGRDLGMEAMKLYTELKNVFIKL
ncbi:MAG: aldehyde dehydrogenase [Myxococcales bacterium]|nr:aldehyde dehydrogenase [Myxococcales bacterium]